MAEVSSNGAAVTSKESDKPVTAAVEAGEATSAPAAGGEYFTLVHCATSSLT